MFSSILLGVLGLFLAFIGGIGGFLIWRGEKYVRKAEEDAKVIYNFRMQAAESLSKTLEAGGAALKTADEIALKLTDVKTKDKEFSNLLSTFEQRKRAFSNASQGTVSLLETPITLASPSNGLGIMDLLKANELNSNPQKSGLPLTYHIKVPDKK